MTTPRSPEPTPPQVAPAVAAWVIPGLGHWLLGRRRQGLALVAAIGLLWLGGLLIGGISVIDHTNDSEWFVRLGQVFIAPSLGVNLWHQALKPVSAASAEPAFTPSLGPVHEQGVLYTGLAGLLNLLAILDALLGPGADPEDRAP